MLRVEIAGFLCILSHAAERQINLNIFPALSIVTNTHLASSRFPLEAFPWFYFIRLPITGPQRCKFSKKPVRIALDFEDPWLFPGLSRGHILFVMKMYCSMFKANSIVPHPSPIKIWVAMFGFHGKFSFHYFKAPPSTNDHWSMCYIILINQSCVLHKFVALTRSDDKGLPPQNLIGQSHTTFWGDWRAFEGISRKVDEITSRHRELYWLFRVEADKKGQSGKIDAGREIVNFPTEKNTWQNEKVSRWSCENVARHLNSHHKFPVQWRRKKVGPGWFDRGFKHFSDHR
jgi:hypothetical protein